MDKEAFYNVECVLTSRCPLKTDFLTEQVYQGLDELQQKLQETV